MLACPSWGQANKKAVPDAGGGGLELANVSGKLQMLQGNSIKILDASKAELLIASDGRTSVRYTGKAKPAWLSQGLMVRFSARLDQQGNVDNPVKVIEAFMPDPMTRRTSPDEIRNNTPGVYPEGSNLGSATKGLFNDKKTETKKADDKKSPKKSDKKKSESEGSADSASTYQGYKVVAQLLGTQKGAMLLNAGGQRLTIEVDPNATINVSVPNGLFAVQGDEVKVTGLRNPQQPQMIQAESIEIKAARILGIDPSQTAKNMKNSKSGNTATSSKKKAAEQGDSKSSAKPEKQPK